MLRRANKPPSTITRRRVRWPPSNNPLNPVYWPAMAGQDKPRPVSVWAALTYLRNLKVLKVSRGDLYFNTERVRPYLKQAFLTFSDEREALTHAIYLLMCRPFTLLFNDPFGHYIQYRRTRLTQYLTELAIDPVDYLYQEEPQLVQELIQLSRTPASNQITATINYLLSIGILREEDGELHFNAELWPSYLRNAHGRTREERLTIALTKAMIEPYCELFTDPETGAACIASGVVAFYRELAEGFVEFLRREKPSLLREAVKHIRY
jgi:hypothetical protein